jgi:hypothetical protein
MQPEAFNPGFGDQSVPQMVDSDFVSCLEQAVSPVVAQPQDDDPAALLLRVVGSGQA